MKQKFHFQKEKGRERREEQRKIYVTLLELSQWIHHSTLRNYGAETVNVYIINAVRDLKFFMAFRKVC